MQTTTEVPPPRLLGRYSYPTSHRVIELVAIVVWIGCTAVLAVRVIAAAADQLSLGVVLGMVLAAGAAYLAADFLSGLVHALCDNLGSVETPVVGQKFIRSFREHHSDPLDMTRGDFVRVNADNFLVCLPVLIPVLLWVDVDEHLFAATFVLALTGLVIVTNQIHKWAHIARIGEPVPASVGWLQRRGVILSPEHHDIHHTPPHESHYCITSGVTNPFLTRIGFWPVLMRGCRAVGRHLPGSPAAGG
ncbi:fatty acid desaturase CarF family protein [Aquihabitans sp. McL0605]|uniref:fatty acid desaturase CarF family protein n=1 Tax=Aquihabitans sp. McL0605 TaxID=3415671 RepID=UPI003CF58637